MHVCRLCLCAWACVCIFSVRLSALKYATIMWHTRRQPPTGSGGRELRFSICCVWPQGNLCIKYNENNNNNTYNKRLQFFAACACIN